MTNQNDDVTMEHEFPWHLGVFDAHCHPTDTLSSVDKIPTMKASALTIMATRRQDQSLVTDFAQKFPVPDGSPATTNERRYIVPSFGWHPWFSHQVYDDLSVGPGHTYETPTKKFHYGKVITPSPEDDDAFLESLPDILSLSSLLDGIRDHLRSHPHALVGEIGIDRAFRIPGTGDVLSPPDEEPFTPGSREGRRLSRYRVQIDHQRRILTAQLNLAGEMQRAVSVHGVAAHGIVYETLSDTWRGHERQSKRASKKAAIFNPSDAVQTHTSSSINLHNNLLPYPPRICLHSYSGPPETLKQYLHPSVPSTIYFSFSKLVNFSTPNHPSSDKVKAVSVIEAVPDDRILVESDLHVAGERMDELLEEIVRIVCEIKKWSLEDGVRQLAENWRRFVYG